MTKPCRICGEVKPLEDFPKHPQMGDGHLHHCRPCRADSNRKQYLKNRSEVLAKQAAYMNADPARRDRSRARARAQRVARKELIMAHLSDHPCADCGESNPVVLEFDHVRGTKLKTINLLVRDGCAKGALEAEIAKCDVVCVNCHTRRTASQQGWYTDAPVTKKRPQRLGPEHERRRARVKAARLRNREYVHAYLSENPCVDCGCCDIPCLQFDHVRGVKVRAVGELISGAAISTLQAEIDKCDVACGNCHRIRTSEQFGSYRGYLS